MRQLQIGVMGSAADLGYGDSVEKLAEEIGVLIAKNCLCLNTTQMVQSTC